MINENLKKNALAGLRGTLKLNESMVNHCSWHAGGNAALYFEPVDIDDLSLFLSSLTDDEEILWLGFGSNLLVRDGGYEGVVISLKDVFKELEIIKPGLVRAGSAIPCAKVARFSAQNSLTGAEFLAGIPGTIGGALAMNAGAFGCETWDIVRSAQTIDRNGEKKIWDKSEVETGYRYTSIKNNECFTYADLELLPDHDSKAGDNIKKLLAQRSQTQPLGQASCGSVFRNPVNDFAARLIETCELKGKSVGDAEVSTKHANFIINKGHATALDIESLMLLVKETVQSKHGIELIPEVRIVGKR